MENKLIEGFTTVKQKLFNCIVILIENWDVLNLAIEKGWGEKNKLKIKASEEVVEKKTIWNFSDEEAHQNLIIELTNYIYGITCEIL